MAQWELNDGAGQVGPLDEDHVIRMLQYGLPPQTVVRAVGETEWRSPRSHAAFAIALEQAKQGAASATPAGSAAVAPAPAPVPAPTQARRVSKSEFVGLGCIVQGLGVFLLFLLPGMFVLLFGEKAVVFGVILGLGAALTAFLTGRKMAVTWSCSACGNRLTSNDARLCPTCRAQLS